jgi:4-hydroxy-3-polyprenylbenzoate decarboxylase
MRRIVVALTGASGAVYGLRLLEALVAAGAEVHLTISPAAQQVFHHEMKIELGLDHFDPLVLLPAPVGRLDDSGLKHYGFRPLLDSTATGKTLGMVKYYPVRDYAAGIASGSFLTAGMVICPCSMGTLASIAQGLSSNLIHRAADVHLKERRKLVLVPRETPLSTIAIGNMKTLADAGAIILPAMPGYYHEPLSLADLVDFIVARVCDQLGVPHTMGHRWSEARDGEGFE